METITLHIDGREITAAAGQTVLDAALAANIYIPHLCTHPDLPAQGNCNMCVVEVDGRDRAVKACETPAETGMRITTKSPALVKARTIALELMLAGHPHDCTSCKAYLKCELQTMMQYLGVVNARMRHIHREAVNINTRNPLIVREMERCIQCGRCVRACSELRGVEALRYNKMGWETYIGTKNNLPLADSGCRFCGACVEVCPTGALLDTEGVFRTDLPKEERLVPCTAECPAKIDIPRYIRYIKDGDCSKSVAVIREKVPFPHALGYICNHRCETGCKREKLNEAIAVRELKRYAVEHDEDKLWLDNYMKPLHAKTGKTVAVAGGGPCGLTAAFYLQKKGHDVTVYERLPIAGGMMTTGMPEYRIPAGDIQKEIDLIAQAGVKILTNSNVTSAADLRNAYDAVLVAIGASRGKKLRTIPGWDNKDAITAVDLLRASRLGLPLNLGGTVNIIGGGNVAFDCARTLIRMGKKVNIVCLEKGDAMLADKEEILEAAEEGAVLYDGATSIRIESDGGRITGHRIVDVQRFYFDENRCLVVETAENTERLIPCDSIVFAAGQATDLTDAFGIELNKFGFPAGSTNDIATSLPGVYAAGDVKTGTRFVIDAIAAGRRAASEIDRYLGGDGVIAEALIPYTAGAAKIGKSENFAQQLRAKATPRPATARKSDFKPVNVGLSEGQAGCEAGRCLQCDLRKQITPVKLWTEYAVKGV